jgi:hypothetical protein
VRNPITTVGTTFAAVTLAFGLAPAAGAVTAATANSTTGRPAVVGTPTGADTAGWYWKCRWPRYRHTHPWICYRHHRRDWDDDFGERWDGGYHHRLGDGGYRHHDERGDRLHHSDGDSTRDRGDLHRPPVNGASGNEDPGTVGRNGGNDQSGTGTGHRGRPDTDTGTGTGNVPGVGTGKPPGDHPGKH